MSAMYFVFGFEASISSGFGVLFSGFISLLLYEFLDKRLKSV